MMAVVVEVDTISLCLFAVADHMKMLRESEKKSIIKYFIN